MECFDRIQYRLADKCVPEIYRLTKNKNPLPLEMVFLSFAVPVSFSSLHFRYKQVSAQPYAPNRCTAPTAKRWACSIGVLQALCVNSAVDWVW
jgi:hypothetical protein